MDRLDAMKLFTRVVEAGSFSAVARESNVSQPTVSKQLAGSENHLGVQLVHRNPRSLKLTEAGQTFYEASLRILSEVESAESEIGRVRSDLRGRRRHRLLSVSSRGAPFSTIGLHHG
jgi:LysR family transcriptional regulator for bpeEF and oprC